MHPNEKRDIIMALILFLAYLTVFYGIYIAR